MGNAQVSPILRYLRQLAAMHGHGRFSDAELLQRVVAEHDEGAFEAILSRHGPMVLGVCRRVLHHCEDAEDCFQATFLVLARQSALISKRQSLGCWLHGVAQRLALKAKADARRRRVSEARRAVLTPEIPQSKMMWHEIAPILDEELRRMAETFRAPLVLCYLEGKTRDEAAQQLGWSLRTLMRRLERGRRQLRQRLIRRGVTISAALLTTGLGNSASAGVPATLADATVRAVMLITAGRAATSVVSANIAALTEGLVKALFLAKVKAATMFIVATGLLAGSFLVSVWGAGVGTAPIPYPRHARQTPNAADPKQQGQLGQPGERAPFLKLEGPVSSVIWSGDGKVMASLTVRKEKVPNGQEDRFDYFTTMRIHNARTGAVLTWRTQERSAGLPAFVARRQHAGDQQTIRYQRRRRGRTLERSERRVTADD
jgi:RNA polymerase sigma factor (sigma-70 family)